MTLTPLIFHMLTSSNASSYKQHCVMHWHGNGGMLELAPLNQESITGARLEHVQSKLDELSERGWKLVGMVATQGKHTYVLQRDAHGPRLTTDLPKTKQFKKNESKKTKKKKK